MIKPSLTKRIEDLERALFDPRLYRSAAARFLATLSDRELEALEREQDPGLACVHHGSADFVPGCDCLDRARALEPGGRSEVQYLAGRLHRGEEPRQAPLHVTDGLPVASLDLRGPSTPLEPPASTEVQEEPGERVADEEPREPKIRRSTDLPESKAKERARLFELDTVRKAEPGDVPGRATSGL